MHHKCSFDILYIFIVYEELYNLGQTDRSIIVLSPPPTPQLARLVMGTIFLVITTAAEYAIQSQ